MEVTGSGWEAAGLPECHRVHGFAGQERMQVPFAVSILNTVFRDKYCQQTHILFEYMCCPIKRVT